MSNQVECCISESDNYLELRHQLPLVKTFCCPLIWLGVMEVGKNDGKNKKVWKN